MSLLAPINLLAIFVAWIDLGKRASDTGIRALDTELAQVNDALTQRSNALEDQAEALAKARKERSTHNVDTRVNDIRADFE